MSEGGLKAAIVAVLGETSEAASICLELIKVLSQLEPSEGGFLTFTSFQNLLGRPMLDKSLIEAVQFLASTKCSVLTARGQLVDEDGNEFTLDDDDFDQVLLQGTVVHPHTGDLLDNAKDLVVPFFVLSRENHLHEEA